MASNNKKPEGGKPAPKIETINLKVLIHCEGCKKKVKKTLNSIEGVHTVEVDESLGKVTVTGTVDSKLLIKKLEKAGKMAEVFQSGSAKGKDQQKANNNHNNIKEGKENKEEQDGDKKDGNGDKGSNTNNGGESGKKKKGGGGPNSTGTNPLDDSMNMVNKSIAPNSIQTGYISMDSADYATHMFSDENANNCHIM